MAILSPGDAAPNFDLTSTEDVVLMLRDEISRTAALLLFFADPPGEGTRRQLAELGAAAAGLAHHKARVLGISPAKPEALKELQAELALPFPLLADDRGFSAHYGVDWPEEGEGEGPAAVLVDRVQRVIWAAQPAPPTGELVAAVERALAELPGPTSNTPGTVVNRVVDWWVNKRSKRRPATVG